MSLHLSRLVGLSRRYFGKLKAGFGLVASALRRLVEQPLTFKRALVCFLPLCFVVFSRSLWTNYIFDEQEALLANPYVNGRDLSFWDVLKVDFWGLPPTRTIGSYRPLPNLVWRSLWVVSERPWWPHFFNIVVHAANAALVAGLVQRWLKNNRAAWLSGACFALSAVLTEAVCGVVGIADVLCGFFTLLAIWAFRFGVAWQVPAAFGFLFLGLLSKESTLTVTPVVVWAALVTAPLDHPARPLRWVRALLVLVAAVGAVVAYTELRRHFFPVALPAEYQSSLPESEPLIKRGFHEFLRWFQQPRLPADPINNPLVNADTAHRIAGALRVYFRGLVQVVFPWQLSGDYSFPQEPIPERLLSFESVAGGLLMVLPPVLALLAWGRSLLVERGTSQRLGTGGSRQALLAVAALALLWVPVTYFPHSNIPIVLPTVRAERFWYLPVIATSMVLGIALAAAGVATRRWSRRIGAALLCCFLGFQGLRARMHALDYRNDLAFWQATAQAVPNSAKAHLNYGVMLGARGKLNERLVENGRARELAPDWPMANIYYADTLCRLKRTDEAWPYYRKGFELGPNEQGLIALALQCLWDNQAIKQRHSELTALAKKHPGSWLAYLGNDMVRNGELHRGVDPKYRPRGYNQKVKDKKSSTATQSASATASAPATASAVTKASASTAASAVTTATAAIPASAKATVTASPSLSE